MYSGSGDNAGVFAVVALIFMVAIYFAPSAVAFNREHRQKVAIFILNLFLGWTLIFWVIALVWSFTAQTAERAPTRPERANSVTDELERLAALRASGAITATEFDELKAKTLAR